MKYLLPIAAITLFHCCAQAADEPAPASQSWQVDGVSRTALVYVPVDARTKETPLIFDFHGHGGSAAGVAKQHGIHKLWPEAICVYMQGLPIATRADPEGKKPGWQFNAGGKNDRDLNFFDAVLASMKKDFKVDPKRVYCTGHSNGGFFTYVLWGSRGDVFAAVAPVAAFSAGGFKDFKALPAMHIAGEMDEIVPLAAQTKAMEAIRKLNHCDDTGKPWANSGKLIGTLYPSDKGAPFVAVLHPGGHPYPPEAAELIVKFFKEQVKKGD
jgi:polyhydroxybutyrate depolymerase